jgi:uncharacterized protein (UPF0303 family)
MTKFLRILGYSPPLLALLFTLLCRPAFAQVDTYTFAASSGTFTPVSATATNVTSILADDAVTPAILLPFTFTFDGTAYTSVRASSNGFLSFAPNPNVNGATVWQNDLSGTLNSTANPPPTANRPLIAPLWEDLDGRTSGSSAAYEVTGAAPNRVFTFQWLNTNRFSNNNGAAAFSFQVKLYETTNVVQTVYRSESGAINGTLSASIGLAGAGTGPSEFLSLSDASSAPSTSSVTVTNTISTFPVTGQVYTFTPSPPVACPNVRGLNVTNVTGTGAQINFRNSATATGYTIVITPLNGTPTTLQATTSPVNLTALSVNSTYTVSVTPTCATGTATPVTTTFTTSNGYCVANLGGVCGANNITDVIVPNTTLNANGLTCTSTTVSGSTASYTNYPAVAPTTGTVQINVPFTISVTAAGTSIVSAWLDWNHNFTFEASEWVQVTTSSTAGTPSTVTYTVPNTNGYTGPTVLRIRSRVSGSPNGSGDACTQFFSGETKDFPVIIAPEPACLQPSGLAAGSITQTSASLSFTSPGAGTYTLVYGPLGFNPAVPATGGTTLNSVTSPVPVTGLQPSTTYQFYVRRDCGAPGLSIFAGPFNFTTLIANDDPCGAITLSMNGNGCVPVGTTSAGATRTTPNGYTNPGTGCGPNTNPLDVWFRFTTDATGTGSTTARITTNTTVANRASAIQVFSAASCSGPFTLVRCGGTANVTTTNLDLTGLTPNTTYYVRVFSYTPANPRGEFTICVTPLPSCPDPTALTALNISKSGALLSFTAGAGGVPVGSSYSVVYGAPGFNPNGSDGTTITGIVGTNYQLTNLLPQQNYCYYVRLLCGGINGNSTLVGPFCFQTVLEAPTNDEPCSAAVLPLTNAVVTSSNSGATYSQQNSLPASLPACAPTTTPRDVWYLVTGGAAPNNAITFTLNGIAAGMVRVYESSNCAAGPFSLVYCRAASGANTGFGGTPFTMPNVVAGRSYYVAISNYGDSDASGAFSLQAQPFFIAPPCEPVTNLAVGSLTAVSASASFTAGVNNTSYTVRYVPTAGGTPVTVTPAPIASPVALTGLTPGTQYTLTVTPLCASGGTASASTTTTFTTPAAPPCNAVAALTAGNITGTSADISFTAGANNTSYTVTYVPTAGGTAITVTPAPIASPVALTGLLSNTNYTVTVTPLCATGGTAPATSTTFNTLPAACGAATSLVADNITTTSADISFTAGVNNTSYTVTYAPTAGGTPVTVNPAPVASPVALSGLTPGTQYTVTITPLCAVGGGTSSASTLVFTTLTPICDPVTAATAGTITTSSASIGFTAGINNTSYSVSYVPTTGGTPVTLTTNASPVSLTGLTDNTQYTVTITPVCAAGGTAPATTFTFATLPIPVCNSVSNIIAGNVTGTSADIDFTAGTNNTSYTVSYAPTAGGPTVTVASTTIPVSLTGLTAGTQYTVTVTPLCASGGTASPTSATFTTLTLPCAAVTGLNAVNVTTTTADVNFTPGVNNTSYTVTYVPTAGGTPVTVNPAPVASPVALSGLMPNTQYTVTITPLCASGGTAPASSFIFTTQPLPLICGDVTGLQVTPLTGTTANVNFTAGVNNTSYTVTYVPTAGGTPVTVNPAPVASPVALSGLTPNTQYTVTITPLCASGGTASASTETFTTPVLPCGAVTGLQVTPLSGTTASVNFTPGINNVNYTVSYVPATGGATQTVPSATTPVSLTGLMPNTTYNVTVTSDCGAGTTPATSGTVSLVTLATRSALGTGQLWAYPNPAHHQLTVAIPTVTGGSHATIQLVNAVGQVVHTQTAQLTTGTTETKMDISLLAAGLYVLRVQVGNESGTLRVMVE